ncbi:hypothetical protein RDABS01_036759 [Bienertia sinuspersici]
MTTLQSSSIALHNPQYQICHINSKVTSGKHLKDVNMSNVNTLFKKNTKTIPPSLDNTTTTTPQEINSDNEESVTLATIKLHVVLEAVLDRIEMHQNIGEQRENWNSLLLNSLNMITLTAATMVSMVGLSDEGSLGLKVASTLLFASATGILLVMNKIQPSQLVEEQRNAVRLLKQLRTTIQTTLSLHSPTQQDVGRGHGEGAMLDKFPNTLKPSMWWPNKKENPMKKMLQ